MAAKRKRTGSALLGVELRRRRGTRTLQDISALSKTPPFSDRVEPIGVSTLYMIEEGQTMPTLRSLQTLATIYRVPVQHLVNLLSLERYRRSAPTALRVDELREETLEALARADYELAWAAAQRWEDFATTPAQRRPALNNKASALWKLGHVDEAALVLLELLADPELRPRQALVAFTNLAEIFRSKGNLRQALVQTEAGLQVAREHRDAKAEAYLLRTRANVRSDECMRAVGLVPERRPLAEGEVAVVEACLEDWHRSSELHRELGLEAEALFNEIGVGQAHCLLGDHRAACRLLEDATRALAARHHDYGEASALMELGRTWLQRGDADRARSLLWKAERLAVAGSHFEVAFNAYFYLMRIESASQGNPAFFFRKCQKLHPLMETRAPEVLAFETLLGSRELAR